MAAAEDPPKPRIVERLAAQRARHRQRPLIARALYIAVGFTVLLGGVAMLLLPGPAFLVIPIGLAVLSLEFAWAEKLLDRALAEPPDAAARHELLFELAGAEERFEIGACESHMFRLIFAFPAQYMAAPARDQVM